MPITEYKKQTRKNMFSKKVEFSQPKIEDYKAYRSEEVLTTTVNHAGYTFEVDEASMDRFDRVIDMANWKYNQAVAQGMAPTDAYSYVYQNNSVTWKTYDNQFVSITIETICELQELALNNLQQIWVKWG